MKILLLAGTHEARQLADALANLSGVEVIASLAGVTLRPAPFVITTRVGGFGGVEGFRRYIRDHNFNRVIVATHPFAVKMAETAATVCAELSVPCLRVLRAPWKPRAGERWSSAGSEAEVADLLPAGARVFLATGPARLADFSALKKCEVFCRRVDEPREAFPFPRGKFIVARPPHGVDDERALFSSLRIDWLVARNSGGATGRTKLDAAHALGLGVVLIERPTLAPDCPHVSGVEAAIDWVQSVKGAT